MSRSLASTRVAVTLALLATAPLTPAQAPAPATSQPSAASVTPDPWPNSLRTDGATSTLYQPHLDSWDGYRVAAHAAVSVLSDDAKDPVFGVVDLAAATVVDRVGRSVRQGVPVRLSDGQLPAARYGRGLE